MKYQSRCAYQLHEHFESPLYDFLSSEENAVVIGDILEKWLQPTITLIDMKKGRIALFELMLIHKVGLPYEIVWSEIKVSGIYMILSNILWWMQQRLADDSVDLSVLISILNGFMVHKYYTTGKFGEKLMDYIDEDLANKAKKVKRPTKALKFWNIIIPFYLEEVDRWYTLDDDVVENTMLKLSGIVGGEIEDKDLEVIKELFSQKETLLKMSDKWIDLLEIHGEDEDIVKGFKQVRVKRSSQFNITFLVAVISVLYFDAKLYLLFERKNLRLILTDNIDEELTAANIYIAMSFNAFVKSVFCEHCFEKYYVTTKKYIQGLKGNTPNIDTIKAMFDEAYNILTKVCPDDVTVTVQWTVKDKSRYQDVNRNIPHGNVWFSKHNNEKKEVSFEFKKNLKSFSKKIDKK